MHSVNNRQRQTGFAHEKDKIKEGPLMQETIIKKFDSLLQNLSEPEQLEFIAYIASKLKSKRQPRRLMDLSGFLAGKVDATVDIEVVLKDVRSQWLKEWDRNW